MNVLVWLLLLAVYLAPAQIAHWRKVPNEASIVVINLLLGWTFVGWVAALALAVRSLPSDPT